ncbi:MAG TPA: hypothetical protein GXX64_12225, partial [Bacteroidales bacterium]|nr:hypothetical protein [Bacteroidales bacterium]
LLSITLFATAQQQGFNYQAAIQKQDGATLHNQEVTLRISLIGQSSNTVYYSETQNSTTNNFGIVSLVIGQGEALSGNFTDIPWESETILISIELKVDNNFVSMGTSPIMAVPYALHATNAVTGTGTAGKIAVWSGDSQLTDVKSFNVNPNVEVISDSTAGDNDPIFEVKNKLGQVVFGVYQAGVRINVDDTNNAKAGKGGFAIGGLSSYKNNDNKFFRVTPDSVRVLLRENQGKAGKGGFAIGGLSSGKDVTKDLFFINPDSARIYINTDSTKAAKGGFAIGGLSSGKGLPAKNIFVATADSTRVYVNADNSKAGKGGFALGGLALVFKRIQALFQIFQFVFLAFLLVPFRVPWAKFLPLSAGFSLIYDVMVEGARLWELPLGSILIAIAVGAVYLAIGLFIFSRCEHVARDRGLLGHY